jgi:hypothetical protein
MDPYKVEFIWSGEKLQGGEFQIVDCKLSNIPGEFKWTPTYNLGGVIGNAVIQHEFSETERAWQSIGKYTAKLSANKGQVVRLPPGRFLYMDVGRWLNGSQTFGVVCGEDAALCCYTPQSGETATFPGIENALNSPEGLTTRARPGSSETGLFEKLMKLQRVAKGPWMKVPAPFPDPSRIYVILPDMHLAPAPVRALGAFPGEQRDISLERRDFFGSRRSVPGAIEFLDVLRNVPWASQITLIQVGDMYELWATRERYFEPSKDPEVVLTLPEENSARQVAKWIVDTHRMYPALFGEIDACANIMEAVFLAGNHDCYTKVPSVTRMANQIFTPRPHSPVTKIYDRLASFARPGIFVEHGHRCDGPNRDGEIYGHDATNTSANIPNWLGSSLPAGAEELWRESTKVADTTRRPMLVVGGAVWWCADGQSFGIHVTGHSHTPDLNYVEVVHKRRDSEIRLHSQNRRYGESEEVTDRVTVDRPLQ